MHSLFDKNRGSFQLGTRVLLPFLPLADPFVELLQQVKQPRGAGAAEDFALHLRSLRIGREVCTSTGTPSHTLLYITKLGLWTRHSERGSSYPEGNFEGNQLLEGSMSLSPLCPDPTNDLHVSTATSFHHSFPWLHCNRV